MKKQIIIFFLLFTSFYGLDLKSIKTFQGNFEQSITNSKKTINYKGKVFLKEPLNILWIYNKPQKKVYIINKSVIIEETDLEQVLFTTLDNEINIINIINMAKENNKNQFIAIIGKNEYKINIKNETIDSINYKDEFENLVIIKFSNSKINSPIDDNIFMYEAPKGFDIVRK